MQKGFITSSKSQFVQNGKPYYYIGANYWYGGLLGNSAEGKIRLKKELDFLAGNNVSNLRVMVGVEGSGKINGMQRVNPALQTSLGTFDTSQLNGLDYLLTEMGKRNMKAVLFLSNNWDWTGGFLQYLNWTGVIADSLLQRKLSWDENRDYVSRFYSCNPCMNAYKKQLELVINRTNSYSRKTYVSDETIMSWEIANEPRPMRPAAIEAYKKWITDVAATIKTLDKNHLVTIGAEGDIGTETLEVYQQVHADKNIDYATIHIWPKNWGWFKGEDVQKDYDSIVIKTKNFISKHVAIAKEINKPMVIEEFGLPRDNHQFNLQSPVLIRNSYFKEIFTIWQQSMQTNGPVAGCNFWAFGGTARPTAGQVFWKPGDDYMGDPPMEEQGLNTVFDADDGTWKLIRSFTHKLKK